MLNAKNARTMFNIFHKKNLNYQRKFILNLIEREVTFHGRDYLIIDEDFLKLRLDSNDWEFFKNLGYDVVRPNKTFFNKDGKEMFNLTFGRISW